MHARTHARRPVSRRGGVAGLGLSAPANPIRDYAQIDATLACTDEDVPAPQAGLSYPGFTAAQRSAFLSWSLRPTDPAPPAFQQLFLASLEVRLLESDDWALKARRDLQALAAAPAWHTTLAWPVPCCSPSGCPRRPRAGGLAGRLFVRHAGTECGHRPPGSAGHTPAWRPTAPPAGCVAGAAGICARRVDAAPGLADRNAGEGPACPCPAGAGTSALQPRPWRCQHPNLRLQLPQPAVRSTLEPLLLDLLSVTEPVQEYPANAIDHETAAAPAPTLHRGYVPPHHRGVRPQPLRVLRLCPAPGAQTGWLHPTHGRKPPDRLSRPVSPQRAAPLLADLGQRSRLDQHTHLLPGT